MQDTDELKIRLLEAWSEPNLNKIARNLIRLYQEKQLKKDILPNPGKHHAKNIPFMRR